MPDDRFSSPHLETDLWRWLLFESGLSRQRAREFILQGAQSSALSLFWRAGPEILAQQMQATPEEAALLRRGHEGWAVIEKRLDAERASGMMTLRLNEAGYPDSLSRFLPAEQRPLLLFLRGEPALLDLPLALPVSPTTPGDDEAAWALETLFDLIQEGASALFMARAGFDARAVREFLEAELPFVLVIPQGLAAYAPPPGLQRALEAERVLLVSPFQPGWSPPAQGQNPMAPHAHSFACALAHGLLALACPLPHRAEGQPCFRRADVSGCEDCRVYEGAESFFLGLAEAAAPAFSGSAASPTQSPSPEPETPVDPAQILETLARGGEIPPALAARLKKQS